MKLIYQYLEEYGSLSELMKHISILMEKEELLNEILKVLVKYKGEYDLVIKNGKLATGKELSFETISRIDKAINAFDKPESFDAVNALVNFIYLSFVNEKFVTYNVTERYHRMILKYVALSGITDYGAELYKNLKKADRKEVVYRYIMKYQGDILFNSETLIGCYMLIVKPLVRNKKVVEPFKEMFVENLVKTVSVDGSILSVVSKLVKEYKSSFGSYVVGELFKRDIDDKDLLLLVHAYDYVSDKVKKIMIKEYLKRIETLTNYLKININEFKKLMVVFEDVCNDGKYFKYWHKIIPIIKKTGVGEDYICYAGELIDDMLDI